LIIDREAWQLGTAVTSTRIAAATRSSASRVGRRDHLRPQYRHPVAVPAAEDD